jgi:hypothetical protein
MTGLTRARSLFLVLLRSSHKLGALFNEASSFTRETAVAVHKHLASFSRRSRSASEMRIEITG